MMNAFASLGALMFPGGNANGLFGYGGVAGPGTSTPNLMAQQAPTVTQAPSGGMAQKAGGTGGAGGQHMIPLRDFIQAMQASNQGY